MGQTLSQSDLLCVGEFVSPTQARAGVCISRSAYNSKEAFYGELTARFYDQGVGTRRVQRRLQARTADVSSHLSNVQKYWHLQSLVCEVCLQRQSCRRERCRSCPQATVDFFPTDQMDMCCSCAAGWTSAHNVYEEENWMISSAQIWKEYAPEFQITVPTELGKDYAGLVVDKQVFRTACEKFVKSILAAREYRSSTISLQALLAKRIGGDAVRQLFNSMFFKCQRVTSGQKVTTSDSVMQQINPLAVAMWSRWLDAPPCQERDFFKLEQKLLCFAEHAHHLLSKASRIEDSFSRKLLDKKRWQSLHGVVYTGAQLLDAFSDLLIGQPASDPEAKVCPLLLSEFGLAICNAKKQPVLHVIDLAAERLLKKMQDEDEEDDLNDLARVKLTFGKHRGLSLLHVWCGNPEYIDWLVRSCDDQGRMQKFRSCMQRLDPDSRRKLNALSEFFLKKADELRPQLNENRGALQSGDPPREEDDKEESEEKEEEENEDEDEDDVEDESDEFQ